MSLMRLAKLPAPEVKAVSHPNSRELGGVESSPLIVIHFSRLRSRAEARELQATGKMLITARKGAPCVKKQRAASLRPGLYSSR
jgi:hypothetical protein